MDSCADLPCCFFAFPDLTDRISCDFQLTKTDFKIKASQNSNNNNCCYKINLCLVGITLLSKDSLKIPNNKQLLTILAWAHGPL